MDRRWELDADAHDAVHAAVGALLVVVACMAVAAASGVAGRAAFAWLSFVPLLLALVVAVVPRTPSRLVAGMLVGAPALPLLEVLHDGASASEHAPGALAAAATVLPVAAFVVALGVDGLLAPIRRAAGRGGHGFRIGLALALATGVLVGMGRRASAAGLSSFDADSVARIASIAFTSVALLVQTRRFARTRAWAAKAEPAIVAAGAARTRSGVLVKLEGAPTAREVVLVEPSEVAADYRGDARATARHWMPRGVLRASEERARRAEWLALFALVWLAVT